MILAAGLVMVAAGATCFGGAIMARRWCGIAAAGLMLVAMVDAAFVGLVPPVIWAGVLLTAGLMLGIDLRFGAGARTCGAPGATGAPLQRSGIDRAVLVSAAVAYPVTAWLLLGHGTLSDGDGGGLGSRGAGTAPMGHRGHGAEELVTGVLPVVGAGALAAVLATLALVALQRRRRVVAVDAGGMAAMLVAMLLAH